MISEEAPLPLFLVLREKKGCFTMATVPEYFGSFRKILDQGLKACGLTEGAFKKILKKEGYRSEDIFLMTCTPQLDYYIVPMNKR